MQRDRKNKVLRGFVHQVRAGRALKRLEDLVQRKRKNKVLRGLVHQVRAGPSARVGAPLPAKPCISVTRRQHFALRRLCPSAKLAPQCRQSLVPPVRGANILPWSAARPPAELAPHCRQSLVPPLRGANILPWSAAVHRPSWRLSAGKTLCLRYGAPTFCPGALPATARVGASVPAKPYASVTGRQHFTLRLGRQPAKFALGCPQSQ